MCPRARHPHHTLAATLRTVCLVGGALALADCGGSDTSTGSTSTSSSSSSGTSYIVGGTVSGLSVSSVVLANGTATVTVVAGSATWAFPVYFAAGTSYSVTVQTQPAGEQCAVTSGGSGMNTGNVGNVMVTCGFGKWTWTEGLNTVNASGVYGMLGTAAGGNVPGARYWSSSWTDSSGNFWLFGGVGSGSTGGTGYLNDLWRYSPSSGQWTWVSGGNGNNASGVYGTQGTAAAGNVPGARQAASSWIDSSGNLWLYGGIGYDAAGTIGNLNDLWRFSPGSGQWTWVSGGNGDNASGVYGTQGTAAAANVPGARYSACSWIDSSGKLWLFGGFGYDSAGGLGKLNDLWQFNPSSGQWTWISGGIGDNAGGYYDVLGTAATGNVPGARQAASSWIDSSGNLWLYGGVGYDASGTEGNLNDLWRFTPSTGLWEWVSGGYGHNASGVYGTLGTASVGNAPGGRNSTSYWIDSSGSLWLFGGIGYDSNGNLGYLNDLWQYNPSTGS